MSVGLSRSLCRLSPQIRNVGFQQVRKNSTQDIVSDVFFNSMSLGGILGASLGATCGLFVTCEKFREEKTFSGKFTTFLMTVPAISIGGALGWVIGGCWPITLPGAIACYAISEKEQVPSSQLESTEKLVDMEKILRRKLSEIQAELSKKA